MMDRLVYGLFRADGSANPALSRFRAAAHYVGAARQRSGGIGDPQHLGGDRGTLRKQLTVRPRRRPVRPPLGLRLRSGISAGGPGRPGDLFDTGFRVALGFWQTYTGSTTPRCASPCPAVRLPAPAAIRQDFRAATTTWDPARGVTKSRFLKVGLLFCRALRWFGLPRRAAGTRESGVIGR